MQRYTVYFIWKLLYMVSGGTSTHHQERIQLYLQHHTVTATCRIAAGISNRVML